MLPTEPLTEAPREPEACTIERIQRRVLWLAMAMIDHANRARGDPSGVKVGGHPASSASMVTLMSTLWFANLRAEDQVSVKPHASPVLHAINYLLGLTDRTKLTGLRAYGGLQSYPSRTKDPGRVDYSTGSVGIGATATIWTAIARRYLRAHDLIPGDGGGRCIALLGDAELDEGAVWEALVDPVTASLGEVLWIVDVNRQSLDRIVPDMAVPRLMGLFRSAGWNVQTAKYGAKLQRAFERPGGEEFRTLIDEMPNEEYQRLLRTPASELRARLSSGPSSRAVGRATADLDDGELWELIRDLGGHDVDLLIRTLRRVGDRPDRPTVIFAYTIKGWNLPIQGHPGNHSALLTDEQMTELAASCGADRADPWTEFAEGSEEARLCKATRDRLQRSAREAEPPTAVPVTTGRHHLTRVSTQQTVGRVLLDLRNADPRLSSRIVTVSPDVASSTNLGGWINGVGVWSIGERVDWFQDDEERLLKWKEQTAGQHIELGIAEVNLVGLLGELGTAWSRFGARLLPIGTIYDPFVGRALEPWAFTLYSGSQAILIGTPSGITLAPEGGAHQSIVTPSIGVEQPGCIGWEPAFAQDLEWQLLYALSLLGKPGGSSSYFRLSTRPIDQSLARVPEHVEGREARRLASISGGYVIEHHEAGASPDVVLAGVGAVMPEVVAAAIQLRGRGVRVDVVCITSVDLVFRAFRASRGFGDGDASLLDRLLPADRSAPIVTVHDAHPHSLSFLGAVRGVPLTALGVEHFGQSGDLGSLHRHYGIDSKTITGAALDLVE